MGAAQGGGGVTQHANEIWAAIIQGLPVAGAAWVGWQGLSTWQTQLRVGRQVEHAEQALAGGGANVQSHP